MIQFLGLNKLIMEEPIDLSIRGSYISKGSDRPLRRVARKLEFSHEIVGEKPEIFNDTESLISLSPLLKISDNPTCNSDSFTFEDEDLESQGGVPLDLTKPKLVSESETSQLTLERMDLQASTSMIGNNDEINQRDRPSMISKLSPSYQLYKWHQHQTREKTKIEMNSLKVTFVNQKTIPTLRINLFTLEFRNCETSEIISVNGTSHNVVSEAPIACNICGFSRQGRCVILKDPNGLSQQFLLLEKSKKPEGSIPEYFLYSLSSKYSCGSFKSRHCSSEMPDSNRSSPNLEDQSSNNQHYLKAKSR